MKPFFRSLIADPSLSSNDPSISPRVSLFAHPATWLILGCFALLCGLAFVGSLDAFLDQSNQALTVPPPQPINVNQLLVRPLFLKFGLVALFVLPLLTAREAERRTMNLVGPPWHTVRDMFFRVLVTYCAMLVVTFLLIGAIFLFSRPEWASIATGYVGLLLIGAAFASVGVLIAVLASSWLPASLATFALSFALGAAVWLAETGEPTVRPLFRHLSVGGLLDDFGKGVIDSGHVVACVSVGAVALFLAVLAAGLDSSAARQNVARPVD